MDEPSSRVPRDRAADDPEERRFSELLRGLARGELDEAAQAELALYAEADPERRAAVENARRARDLGGTWLRRVDDDAQVEALQRRPLVRIERRIGVGLFVGGLGMSFLLPAMGAGMLAAGAVTLLWSYVRLAWVERNRDPYRRIDR
ncbi:MAG: hypothetical protein D6705_16940 [Deltaproteobacteria bacterium]|nr:MAG: hypothetical protein D6705_16940 [Deltaproteobacteria bacterium]